MNTKNCPHCNQIKPIQDFHKNQSQSSGLEPRCKLCKKYYREKNKDRISTQMKEWRLKRLDKEKEQKKKYFSNPINREKRNKWIREYNKKNRKRISRLVRECRNRKPERKIAHALRNRLIDCMKKSDETRTFKLLGCSLTFFKEYLESLWTEGMNWDNYGKFGWHIDHIKACNNFSLQDIEEQKKCFHYTNMQPMWWLDNIKKSDNF